MLPTLYDNDLEDLDNLDFLCEPDSSNQERWDHVRINWDLHVEKLLHEKHFSTEYRMSFNALCDLCLILSPLLERKHEMSRSQERITVTIIVACGLRFLAGGKASDQKHIFGLSRAEVYRDIHLFLKAVNEAPELFIVLPVTPEEWEKLRSGFARKSYNELFHGCVGALDGFFQPTNAPTRRESFRNVLAYYSGHYESNGLHCQTVCGADLKFTFFGVVGPGKTNDNVAFPRCVDLYKTVMDLPPGLFFFGDAAYDLCETLLVPFTGSQRADQNHNAYNFNLSQLRIRIEMSFGRLVRKFAILKRKLECRLSTSSSILMACAKLHNCVIKSQLKTKKDVEENDDEEANDDNDDDDDDKIWVDHAVTQLIGAPLGLQYLPIFP